MFKPNCSYYQAYRPEVFFFFKLLFLKNMIDFELFLKFQCHEPDIHNYIICLTQMKKNKLKLGMLQQDC